MAQASYRFSPEKAVAAVQFMASQDANLDLHTAFKACYFSDKSHLNTYHQPIFGAKYRAMKYGPVPLEVYEIIKGESLWLWELGIDEMPWRLNGHRIEATEAPPQSYGAVFSESEMEHLQAGFERSRGMSFTARTAATHGPDWQAAEGGMMRYEDMIEDVPDREGIIEYLQETARHVRL